MGRRRWGLKGKQICSVLLAMSLIFLLSGCNISEQDNSLATSIDLENIHYYYFEKMYNDLMLIQIVKSKIENEDLAGAKGALELYKKQRDSAYQTIRNDAYNQLEEYYDDQYSVGITDLVQEIESETFHLINELDHLFNSMIDNEVNELASLVELMANYEKSVDPSLTESRTVSNVSLHTMNLLNYPHQNLEQYNLSEIKNVFEHTLSTIQEMQTEIEALSKVMVSR